MQNGLRGLRQTQGWTQQQVGDGLGVSRQAVNAIEMERHDPSLDLAYRIAAMFQRPVEDIFPNAYRPPHPRRSSRRD